jgi:hypothetical protein
MLAVVVPRVEVGPWLNEEAPDLHIPVVRR